MTIKLQGVSFKWLFLFLITPLLSSRVAAEYGFSNYYFIDPSRAWHIEGKYRAIDKASFASSQQGFLYYTDADASLYYSQFINNENSISYEIGYDFLRINWAKNPGFHETQFNYLIGSIGYVSTTLERWIWVINAGFSVDAARLDFAKSGVGHGMVWGRYQFTSHSKFHLGILGWYGILNGKAFPIFGFEWLFNDRWKANVVYPGNFSLEYSFLDHWMVELAYAFFGGPYYRYPRRAYQGINGLKDPIFTLFSSGAELNIKFLFEHLFHATLGFGWDFSGWILIKDQNNHNGHYYPYKSAPFIKGDLRFTF